MEFLAVPVPPGGTPDFLVWQARCKSLGAHAPEVFINVLKVGPEALHYGALLGLRMYGFEAWGDGYGSQMKFRIRHPPSGDWDVITPARPPQSGAG